MAWETRGNKRYWYESYRAGGKVRKLYIGDTSVGQLAEIENKLARWERQKQRWDTEDEAERDQLTSDAVAAFCVVTEALIIDVLTEAGYHRPQRGKWRRKRVGKQGQGEHGSMASDDNDSSPLALTEPASAYAAGALSIGDEITPAEIEVLKRASKGDMTALASMRAILKRRPQNADRMTHGSIAGRNAQAALIELACGDNLLARELWQRQADDLASALAGGPAPSGLETVLIERIVVCRMELNYYLGHYARQLKTKAVKGVAVSATWDDHKQRRMDRAQRRFLAAVKALAEVRRLQLPAIQVNIAAQGGQQVNTAL